MNRFALTARFSLMLFPGMVFFCTLAVAEPAVQSQSEPQTRITTPTLDARISALETAQTSTIAALNASNEQYKFLLTTFGAAIGALVVIQGFVSFIQLRRDSKREFRQQIREVKWDKSDLSGAQQVSEIMTVVKDTVQNRLDAEQEARRTASQMSARLDEVLTKIHGLDMFYTNIQNTINNERNTVENIAGGLAREPRHKFRQMLHSLNQFAQRFDMFKTQSEPIAAQPSTPLGAKALYIRGIAAHYSNEPDTAIKYLTDVVKAQNPEPGEALNAYQRRIANAYYYLGVIESNFGMSRKAVDSLDEALRSDAMSNNGDFLTKLVAAEACCMKGIEDFKKADTLLTEVEEGLESRRIKEGKLTGIYRRLRSRAILIRANIVIIERSTEWEQSVLNLLTRPNDDPTYYYLTATLGQVFAFSGNDQNANEQFEDAYANIERSGDLLTVTETRSLVLLHMVAGLCCSRHDQSRSTNHLDQVETLLNRLPISDGQTCTVFSTVSKQNENSATIREHLNMIRNKNSLICNS